MQSGCAFNPWAFNDRHREAAFNLAKQLGCQKEDPKEIIQYLLKIPAADLVKCTTLKIKFEVSNYTFFFNFIFMRWAFINVITICIIVFMLKGPKRIIKFPVCSIC